MQQHSQLIRLLVLIKGQHQPNWTIIKKQIELFQVDLIFLKGDYNFFNKKIVLSPILLILILKTCNNRPFIHLFRLNHFLKLQIPSIYHIREVFGPFLIHAHFYLYSRHAIHRPFIIINVVVSHFVFSLFLTSFA